MHAYLAEKAAKQKVGSFLEPLLSDDESSDDECPSDPTKNPEDEVEKQTPLQKLKTMTVYGVLMAGVGMSAAAMVLSPVVMVFVAGGICCANVPHSAYKEMVTSKMPTLRSLNSKLRQDANRLASEVDGLSNEIDLLEPEADRAAAVKEELQGIADKQKFNVDKLVELVKENGEILEKMKDNLRHRIAQDVIRIVVNSDRDGDGSISRKEAISLSLQIKVQLDTYGVQFDVNKFIKVVETTPSVSSIIAIVQKLLEGGNGDDEEDDMHDMFHIQDDVFHDDAKADGKVDNHEVRVAGMDEDRYNTISKAIDAKIASKVDNKEATEHDSAAVMPSVMPNPQRDTQDSNKSLVAKRGTPTATRRAKHDSAAVMPKSQRDMQDSPKSLGAKRRTPTSPRRVHRKTHRKMSFNALVDTVGSRWKAPELDRERNKKEKRMGVQRTRSAEF
eukprot:scaffold43448_cov51-Cyclotella_meneghiniana.AAC.11